MSERGNRRPPSDDELPVLTDVAISGDVARQRGLYFAARARASEPAADSEAERYLAQRLKVAVREGLTEAMVRAARGASGSERPRDRDRDKGER